MPPGFSVPAFSFSRSPFPVQNHRGLLAAKFRRIHAAVLARPAVIRVQAAIKAAHIRFPASAVKELAPVRGLFLMLHRSTRF